jgi:hypothetical protein
MIVRSIDSNNDWLFGKGKNDYKRGLNAIQQSIKTRLQEFLGDCFFAQNNGIDWFNLLGSKNQQELGLAISSVILNTEDVTRITEFDLTIDNSRNALIQYEVETIYGRSLNAFQLELEVG